MKKNIVIVGGGTAGWICAGYLASTLGGDPINGVQITLVESKDIGTIGVGEGSIPSLRKTLSRMGLDETRLVREAGATFKQGVRFRGWRRNPGALAKDIFYHPFQIADQHSELDLLPFWLSRGNDGVSWAHSATVQPRLMDENRAPKLISQPSYAAPVNYAYHFDAAELTRLLRSHVTGLGVRHIIDTVQTVDVDERGFISSVLGARTGGIAGDFFIDCSGFAARLIGQALGTDFRSLRHQLFCDRAVAFQVPYVEAKPSLASCTISTAQAHGWNWDIGLMTRKGLGYVYSSQHCEDDTAEAVLRDIAGQAGRDLPARRIRFEAGYRDVQWRGNCVAVGLSAGFIEPLEATGIWFAEIASLILANLLPWSEDYAAPAKQFNSMMCDRYGQVADFIKLHYCLSQRNDTDFWQDNRREDTISDALRDRLERWRFRAPSFVDAATSNDIFAEQSWQYILYGMGFGTNPGPGYQMDRRGSEAAGRAFADVRRQTDYALEVMPDHRALIEAVHQSGFQPRPGG